MLNDQNSNSNNNKMQTKYQRRFINTCEKMRVVDDITQIIFRSKESTAFKMCYQQRNRRKKNRFDTMLMSFDRKWILKVPL